MNASFKTHLSEDVLELYTMDKLPDAVCASAEEHLLICEACQLRLQETDEYVRIAKAAAEAELRRDSPSEGPILRKQPGSAQAFC